MARLEWIEQRLLNWAEWKLRRSGGSLGFAAVELGAAPTPTKRDPYAQAAVPVNDVEASETDDAVELLVYDQRLAVCAWYLRQGGKAQASATAGMAPSTMFAKIEQAHHRLSEIFGERNRDRLVERGRVEKLQNAMRRSAARED